MVPVHAGTMPGSAVGLPKVLVGHQRELVREHQFLDESRQDHGHAVLPFRARRSFPVPEVVEEFARAHDRPGHQLREERHEQRVVDVTGHHGLFAAINIDHVRDALERMKADAERQDDVERVHRGAGMENVNPGLAREVRVLEPAEHPDVRGQTDQQRHAPRGAFTPADPERREVVHRNQAEDQHHELRVPRHVKEEARGEQQIAPEALRQHVERASARPAETRQR